MIRLLLCDDQSLVCEGLRSILNLYKQFEIVGVAHDGSEAIALARQTLPDVVLMDLKMPRMNGVQATRILHQELPQIKVLVLSTYAADEWVIDAIRAGAAGYLLKDTPRERLVAAIEDVVRGNTPVDPKVAGTLFRQACHGTTPQRSAIFSQLGEREMEILTYLAQGLGNAQIAQRLFLSEGTVRNYVSSILAKLGVTDRTQAALLAAQYDLSSFPIQPNHETPRKQ